VSLLMCGIDEAGYGPLLGPLSVGAAVVSVRDWEEGMPAPDLWKELASGVAPGVKGANGRVVIADSKALKLQGIGGGKAVAGRHPLMHLERGVLAWLAWMGQRPVDDDGLLECLGTWWPPHRCYEGSGEGRKVPLVGGDGLGILANSLKAASGGRVVPVGLRCRLMGEAEFNRVVRESSGKGATTLVAIREHAQWFMELARAHKGHHLRLVCDRLGGREKYGDIVEYLFAGEAGGVEVRALEEGPERSRYVARVPGADRECGCEVGVVFEVGSEKAYLPIALASMAAKLCRELSMERFNGWWGKRVKGLKPTAGYWQDAQRWLKVVGRELSASDKRELVRIA